MVLLPNYDVVADDFAKLGAAGISTFIKKICKFK